VAARDIHALCADQKFVALPARLPRSIDDLERWGRFFIKNDLGLGHLECLRFVRRMLLLATSSEERQMNELERATWWAFIRAEEASPPFRKTFVEGSRMLVASRARESSARTYGTVFLRLVLGMVAPGTHADQVLNGPTSEVWIKPWLDHLRRLGVDFRTGSRITALQCEGRRIKGVEVASGWRRSIEHADHYVAALPLEAITPLISDPMKEADPRLAGVAKLRNGWMSGIQLYFDRDVAFAHGHTMYADSPWALISIAQGQFWPGVDLAKRGDGTVRDILSLVISEWSAPGILYGKPASRCTREQIKDEVLAQVRAHLYGPSRARFDEARLVTWFLDPSIVHVAEDRVENQEPLFVSTPGSWEHRPDAVTGIENLFLASDYVRTEADLASMEAANEAARRAVNGVLAAAGSSSPPCELFRLWPAELLAPLKAYDRQRFRANRRHILDDEPDDEPMD
jgi:uncharacterized protein with NAD-binding domain and iron-sulfur cluster